MKLSSKNLAIFILYIWHLILDLNSLYLSKLLAFLRIRDYIQHLKLLGNNKGKQWMLLTDEKLMQKLLHVTCQQCFYRGVYFN